MLALQVNDATNGAEGGTANGSIRVDKVDAHQQAMQALLRKCGINESVGNSEQQIAELARSVDRIYGPLYGRPGAESHKALLEQLSAKKTALS